MASLKCCWKTLLTLSMIAFFEVRAYPQEELQMAIMSGMGMAKDLVDSGAAVKSSKNSEIAMGPAKTKVGYDVGFGFGDAMNDHHGNDDNNDKRKRRHIDHVPKMRVRREPCNQRRLRMTTTEATDIDARRKRDVNDMDVDNNVLPDEEIASRTSQLSDSIKEAWTKMMQTVNQWFDGIKQKLSGV